MAAVGQDLLHKNLGILLYISSYGLNAKGQILVAKLAKELQVCLDNKEASLATYQSRRACAKVNIFVRKAKVVISLAQGITNINRKRKPSKSSIFGHRTKNIELFHPQEFVEKLALTSGTCNCFVHILLRCV